MVPYIKGRLIFDIIGNLSSFLLKSHSFEEQPLYYLAMFRMFRFPFYISQFTYITEIIVVFISQDNKKVQYFASKAFYIF
jgi:hypothetical protein